MPSIKTALAATVITLFATGNAHMIMASPASYGKPDKSPLAADGSNFPCKATSNSGAPVTNMAIGQQQILSFNGTAVHGGGSCQISLTTDSPATKNSKWMVIHSIEGGCPARNTAGNLPEGANPDTTADPDTYKYSIPAGVAPGAYTLAWTWFNKVGNREMYMNCASIKVTGGSGKRDTPRNEYEDYFSSKLAERASASFPSMFVANIGTGCTTADGGDLQFPDPGQSVETNTGYKGLPPTGNCAASGSSASAGSASGSASSGSGSGSSGSGSSGSASNSGSASSGSGSSGAPDSSSSASSGNPQSGASTGSASSGSPSNSGSGSASNPSTPDTSSNASSGNAQSGGAPPAPSMAAAAPASSPATAGSGSAASSGASTGSCSSPGQSICSPDGTGVGTCTQGNTVTWVKLATGTKCAAGNVVAA